MILTAAIVTVALLLGLIIGVIFFTEFTGRRLATVKASAGHTAETSPPVTVSVTKKDGLFSKIPSFLKTAFVTLIWILLILLAIAAVWFIIKQGWLPWFPEIVPAEISTEVSEIATETRNWWEDITSYWTPSSLFVLGGLLIIIGLLLWKSTKIFSVVLAGIGAVLVSMTFPLVYPVEGSTYGAAYNCPGETLVVLEPFVPYTYERDDRCSLHASMRWKPRVNAHIKVDGYGSTGPYHYTRYPGVHSFFEYEGVTEVITLTNLSNHQTDVLFYYE